ncbi:MAG: hypothetical protein ACREQJ_12775, partial [Candidatus Binatia bacterium]
TLDCGPVDTDEDGVNDEEDLCRGTDATSTDKAKSVVDAEGCSIDQRCPCDDAWKNHGAYVSCTTRAANRLNAASLITGAEKGAITSAAAQSECGS